MTTLELLEKYPKAAVVVKSWFLEKMLDSLKNDTIPDEFKEYVRQQGIEDEKVAKILGSNPRTLFDVFDANQLYIKIDIFVGDIAKFSWSINGHEAVGPSLYTSRPDAEKDAVSKAFQMLNDKL